MRRGVLAEGPPVWPEFTQEEFIQALRRIMPELEATQLACDLAPGSRASPADMGILPEAVPAGGTSASGVSFVSGDMLILLSLESEVLRRKVEQYRFASNGGRLFTDDQQRKWNVRLAQFVKWKEAGYPLDGASRERNGSEEQD